MSDNNKNTPRGNADRSPYESPRIREFGSVGALTQGGSGKKQEAKKSSSPIRFP